MCTTVFSTFSSTKPCVLKFQIIEVFVDYFLKEKLNYNKFEKIKFKKKINYRAKCDKYNGENCITSTSKLKERSHFEK